MKRIIEEKRQAAKAKRERVRAIVKQIGQMTPEARAEIAQRMPVINPEGHALSLNNVVLLALQSGRTDFTVVAGFRQWRKAGRYVRKDEHGYLIWFPVKSKAGEDAESDEMIDDDPMQFLLVTVFDISQTHELVDIEDVAPGIGVTARRRYVGLSTWMRKKSESPTLAVAETSVSGGTFCASMIALFGSTSLVVLGRVCPRATAAARHTTNTVPAPASLLQNSAQAMPCPFPAVSSRTKPGPPGRVTKATKPTKATKKSFVILVIFVTFVISRFPPPGWIAARRRVSLR